MSEYSARKLYLEHKDKHSKPVVKAGVQLNFSGTGDLDIYNPTSPFMMNGFSILAARVEPRKSYQSRVFLFQEKNGTWNPFPDWQPISMEDPFLFRLSGTDYLGGVEIFPENHGESVGWQTVVYDISILKSPVPVFRGPKGMKDIRFIEYDDGCIGVFSRPQGGSAGRGTCAYMECDSIHALNADELSSASFISSPDRNSWEGINQPILIGKDMVGLLGHMAWMEKGEIRHYYVVKSEFSRKTQKKTPWFIIACRSDLPPGPSKREDLADVLFPGGIKFISAMEAVLYLGVSDTQAWECSITNPFPDFTV